MERKRARMDMTKITAKTYAAMRALTDISKEESGLDEKLLELVKVRVSQMNACAYCLDMHIRSARVLGISDDKLQQLNAWRESPAFSDAEYAALELAEAVTHIASGVSDALYERVRKHYTEAQYLGLLAAINVMNAWNRFMVGVGAIPRGY